MKNLNNRVYPDDLLRDEIERRLKCNKKSNEKKDSLKKPSKKSTFVPCPSEYLN